MTMVIPGLLATTRRIGCPQVPSFPEWALMTAEAEGAAKDAAGCTAATAAVTTMRSIQGRGRTHSLLLPGPGEDRDEQVFRAEVAVLPAALSRRRLRYAVQAVVGDDDDPTAPEP